MSLTPEKLRDVAWALDVLTKTSRALLEPIAAMDEIGAPVMEVTVEVSRDGNPLTPEEALTLLYWLNSDEMQDDLRAEADRRSGPLPPHPPAEMSLNEKQSWKEGWIEGWIFQPKDADGGEEE